MFVPIAIIGGVLGLLYVVLDARLRRAMDDAASYFPPCEIHDEWVSDEDAAYWTAWRWRLRLRHGFIWSMAALALATGQPLGALIAPVVLYSVLKRPKRSAGSAD